MKHVRTALVVLAFWTVVAGGAYPLLVTGIGAVFFRDKAQGSIVRSGGKVAGSSLIGQGFENGIWFHSRPSAVGYDSSASGAGNGGYTNADLKKAHDQRRDDWRKAFGPGEPPAEMLYASGSGLDPDISPQAAEAQVPAVAAARYLTAAQAELLLALVRGRETGPQMGFLGEPRVNVLQLNMALDAAFPR
jgi:potassium-transporting ATPase KdpC subunit